MCLCSCLCVRPLVWACVCVFNCMCVLSIVLFIPPDADASQSTLLSEIPIARGGFTILGCPIGPPEFCEEALGARLQKLKASLGVLCEMGDAK